MKPLSDTSKDRIKRLAVKGPLRPLAKPFHHCLLRLSIIAHRAADALAAPEPDVPAGNVTALIKTFERPQRCKALVASIKRLHPGLGMIVVDDSRVPCNLAGVKTHPMPYDSGVSAGRSAGLKLVDTRYVLNLDDDFIFYRHTGLGAALKLMEEYPEIDIMGGVVVELPLNIIHDYRKGTLLRQDTAGLRRQGVRIGNLEVFDKVPNFFIARVERLRLVDWDSRLKRLDHADFFTRAKGVLVSVLNPDLRILHVRDPFDEAYLAKRLDLEDDYRHLAQKYDMDRDP